jgi:hypothetical protein
MISIDNLSTNKRSAAYRRRYAKNKQLADAIKKIVGCERCRKQKPASELQFHHLRGKKNIAVSMLYRISRKQMLEEIAKCDILCRECHRKRHDDERSKE